MVVRWVRRGKEVCGVVSSSPYLLTRVTVVQDHLAEAALQPRQANRLQAKLDPAAGLQVGQSEHKGVLLVPHGHLPYDMVCTIEVKDGEKEQGVLEVLRAAPGQRHAATVPGRHLKVLGNVWICSGRKKNILYLLKQALTSEHIGLSGSL